MKTAFVRGCLMLIAVAACAADPPYAPLKQWGEFGIEPGRFRYPAGIAVDGAANVYVVDQHNHRVQKFDAEGRFLLTWGKEGGQEGQFKYPFGVAIDSRGDVYVSDMDNHRVQKFSPRGEFIRSVGRYGAGASEFKHPYGLAFDGRDILYVIDTLNYRIQKFDRDFKHLGSWGSEEAIGVRVYMPHDVAVLQDGAVALSDRQNHRISIFSAEGKLLRRFGDHGEGAAAPGGRFSEPHGLAVAPDGSLLVCDRYNFRVQTFTAGGEFKSSWPTVGAADDMQHYPLAVATDRAGNVYVTDHYQHSVRKYGRR